MDIIRKNVLLYTVIIIIPTIIAILIFTQVLESEKKMNVKNESLELGKLHQQYIETLIKETNKSLDILSIVAMDMVTDTKQIEKLLIQTKKTDKRYGDLYFVGADGVLKAGSTSIYNGIKVKDSYVKACTDLKKTYVSSKKETDTRNQDFFFICKPILKQHDEILGYIIVQLRLDYIKNVLELLTPNTEMKLTDNQNHNILSINSDKKDNNFQETIPFEEVSWTLHISSSTKDVDINTNALLKFIILFLIITHIIFLAVQLILLNRDAAKQKKDYDNQKLKMIGTLAATTAHEIKNPLTGIKGLVQLLSEKYNDSKDQMYFSIIQKEITRINEIVSEFLVLGKPSVHQLDVVDLCKVIKEIQPVIESEGVTYSVNLKVHLPDEPVYINCITDQIKQVIINIAKNSFEACKPGMTVSLNVVKNKKNVLLAIADQGAGMSKDTLQKIFEPFFTTKNYGTGLGLFLCNRIITQLNGTISVHSKQNEGTTICISLPLSELPLQEV
ncbi:MULTISPECIES: PAS domain-containing sensor histidine kinase [Bacillus]|uniref:PAS domain-containing sensor histidine kinase n=1 Tax=Bacillus TaxID=1386 RepID=UPI0002D4C0B6|nr:MULTISPECIES: PAS domain-containing sensor histidine kinase [Bacillus]